MSQQSYDDLISNYLTKPVEAVTTASGVDELFAEYFKPTKRTSPTGAALYEVPLHIVCASVYEPHRANIETDKMLKFMKIDDARKYFWDQLAEHNLHVVGIHRGETWERSSVHFSPDIWSSPVSYPQQRYRNQNQDAATELKELMESALQVLSSMAKLENAKAVGQL